MNLLCVGIPEIEQAAVNAVCKELDISPIFVDGFQEGKEVQEGVVALVYANSCRNWKSYVSGFPQGFLICASNMNARLWLEALDVGCADALNVAFDFRL
jgi:hypothetical protein